MAITSSGFATTAGVAKLITSGSGTRKSSTMVYIRTTLTDLYIGGPGVAAATGILVSANTNFSFEIASGELWAFSATGGIASTTAVLIST